jgi:hypothetical protein
MQMLFRLRANDTADRYGIAMSWLADYLCKTQSATSNKITTASHCNHPQLDAVT